MKNKLRIILLYILICFPNLVLSNSFILESKNIEILKEKNQIISYDGKAISKNNDLSINSDKFVYFVNLDILESIGNGNLQINSKNLFVEYDKAIFDQKKFILNAEGNIKIYPLDKTFILETEKIFYNQKTNIFTSNNITKIKDDIGNIYLVDSFKYELDKNILKVRNLFGKDINNNTFKTSIAYINTLSGRIFGKDIKLDLENQSIGSENKYMLKGNSAKIFKESSEITKGVFTTCKKRDGCPPWQFNAKKIKHDKKNKEIIYDDALLKIYDIPILYFPKFFHPDPTVKRRSGFLIPSIKNSNNSDNYLNLPYFHVIAENKDLTISPRLFFDEKFLVQAEYRQKNFKSNHLFDLSLFSEKDENSKNHLFYNFDKDLETVKFETVGLSIKTAHISNDTYLKSERIKSDIITDNSTLENSINLELYSNDLSININSTIYENLNKQGNDRYEYILPEVNFVKNINNLEILDGDLVFESNNLIRQYNTNILERENINNLIFQSNNKINSFGILNNYELLLKNSNSSNKKTQYKNKKNFYFSGIFQHNSILPLISENEYYQKILKPKLSFKIAPNHTKDLRDEETKIDINNVYSVDRASDRNSVEGGLSLTYGVDFSISDKIEGYEKLNFKIANNFRYKENDDLSNSNQIGEKISNIFNEIEYKPNKFFSTKYTSSFKNDFNSIVYENLNTELNINKFITAFDYLNENNTIQKNSYLSSSINYSLDDFNNLKFATRKNKTKNLTEYYNFMYQYKNDCLAASIEYNKDFYNDRELKPEENITFKLTIIPFGETTSPNLKK